MNAHSEKNEVPRWRRSIHLHDDDNTDIQALPVHQQPRSVQTNGDPFFQELEAPARPQQLKDEKLESNTPAPETDSTSNAGTTPLTTVAPTLYTASDSLLDPESVVVFNRSVHYNGLEYKNPENKGKISIDGRG